jgi:tRNA uridine 5-carbamoylmethylation protein Kti12
MQKKKTPLTTIGMMVGWGVTILAMVWQLALKDAAYANSIQTLEEEVEEVIVRVDDTETFRLTIVDQLSEIKTDLRWIKQRLSELNER